MRKIPIVVLITACALAACGQASTGGASAPTAAPSAAPAAAEPTVAPTVPTSPPTAQPAPVASPGGPKPGGGTSVRPPDALVSAAQQRLAAYLKLDTNAVVLQSANRQEWPDGALGCPQAGMAYPQIVTPGFLLVFTDPAQTQSYEVHTAMSEAQMVLCMNKQPIDIGSPSGDAPNVPTASAPNPPATTTHAGALSDDAQRSFELARAALAQELNIQPRDVTLVQAVPQEWNDSSLGCPKPDQSYLQVITAGYIVTVQAQGKNYEYHTDLGKRAVRCEQ